MNKYIFLILSSNNDSIYEEFKVLQKKYLRNYRPFIKYYFLEFRENQEQEILEEDDTLYVKGVESITPGMIIKTCKAIEYINSKFDYEFMIRTNLSTLFHIPNLLEYLSSLPKENVSTGFSFSGFITGTGIILSKDVAVKLVNTITVQDMHSNNEDVMISHILRVLGIPHHNCNSIYKWCLIIEESPSNFPEFVYIDTSKNDYADITFPENTLHFRIKNSSNRKKDIFYFKQLLYKIYNIT